MSRAVQQAVGFGASARALCEIYLDAQKHSAAIGSRVSVSRRAGGRFSAFNDWKAGELDSILILTFSESPRGGRIDLVHAGVPDRLVPAIRDGWRRYYWKPWRAYLKKLRPR